MEDNSEYRIDEPIKAHGIIIGAMILTLLLVLGFDSLIDWWFRVKGDLPSIVYLLLFVLLIALAIVMLFVVLYIPNKSVDLSMKYAQSRGTRFIVYGAVGVVLSVVLFFVFDKKYSFLIPFLYSLVVLVKGIEIAKKK
jgi:hypothetical protein